MLKGFKEFVLRGNVMDLAVAVVIGAALTAVINALVEHLITPLIAALFGQPNLDDVWVFTINEAEFSIGAILTALINFLLVAAAVYLFIVVPMNKLMALRSSGQEQVHTPGEDIQLLREIRDLLAQGRQRG
ncbi:MAG TPA: large conductance mechanosensitive channel protein MscL [Jiangellaceae bacterium]|nr:large conductance mechanosensitive channel protein MscL [Jiangellaceae bacterium]